MSGSTPICERESFVLSQGILGADQLSENQSITLAYGTYLADARDRSPREMPLDSWLQRPLELQVLGIERPIDIEFWCSGELEFQPPSVCNSGTEH
jgi:hypothetical protein